MEEKTVYEPSRVPREIIWSVKRELQYCWCPDCGQLAPLNLYTTHRVYSLFLLTTYYSYVSISCPSCALKDYLKSLLFCLFLGWWAIPWGLIITPIQILRNLFPMLKLGLLGDRGFLRGDALEEWVYLQLEELWERTDLLRPITETTWRSLPRSQREKFRRETLPLLVEELRREMLKRLYDESQKELASSHR